MHTSYDFRRSDSQGHDSHEQPGHALNVSGARIGLRSPGRVWMVALALFALTADVWAQTELRQCNRRIRTTGQIGSCVTTSVDIDHPVSAQLENITSTLSPTNAPGLTCYFQFWSFGGAFFPSDQLPREVTVEGGESGEATAWYLCSGSGSCPPGQHCPFRTEVYGIDTSSSTFVPRAFVESTDPTQAIGNCDTDSPCRTTPDRIVNSITAEAEVSGLQFLGWMGSHTDSRTLEGPFQGGVKVALYRDPEPDTCSFGTFQSGQFRLPCRPLIPYEDLEIVDLERPWTMELDRICHYVLNCPGCGPFELCAPFGWNFEGEGVEALQIMIHDRITGEILAKGEAVDGGGQTVWFTPEKGDFSRYFVSFVPHRNDPKAEPIHLKPSLDVSLRKP